MISKANHGFGWFLPRLESNFATAAFVYNNLRFVKLLHRWKTRAYGFIIQTDQDNLQNMSAFEALETLLQLIRDFFVLSVGTTPPGPRMLARHHQDDMNHFLGSGILTKKPSFVTIASVGGRSPRDKWCLTSMVIDSDRLWLNPCYFWGVTPRGSRVMLLKGVRGLCQAAKPRSEVPSQRSSLKLKRKWNLWKRSRKRFAGWGLMWI